MFGEKETRYCNNVAANLGYTQISTFAMDFGIANGFGKSAIIDTYNRALKFWKRDYKMLTELVIVLNWLLWYAYDTNQSKEMQNLYYDLYFHAKRYASEHLQGNELDYFYKTID